MSSKDEKVIENIPSNEEILAVAETTREGFYKDVFTALGGLSEDQVRRMVESKGNIYTPDKASK